jgi:hypothetical protein
MVKRLPANYRDSPEWPHPCGHLGFFIPANLITNYAHANISQDKQDKTT